MSVSTLHKGDDDDDDDNNNNNNNQYPFRGFGDETLYQPTYLTYLSSKTFICTTFYTSCK
jgi:hypothetical protein